MATCAVGHPKLYNYTMYQAEKRQLSQMKNYLNNKLETLTVCAHSYLLHQLRAKETVFQRRRGTGGHFRH